MRNIHLVTTLGHVTPNPGLNKANKKLNNGSNNSITLNIPNKNNA